MSRTSLLTACFVILAFLSVITSSALAADEPKASEPASSAAPTPAESLKATSQGIDVVCESDISYTWKRGVTKDKEKDNKAVQTTEEPQVTEVFYTTAGEHGTTEEEVKSRINSRLPAFQAEALDHCRRIREDQASCISNGLKSYAKDYNVLDFGSRKTLVTAITSDCQRNSGSCLGATSSPIRCYLNRPAEVVAEKAEAQASDKDQKDKKKKK